jgi:uncharacterized protein (DUF362 family)
LNLSIPKTENLLMPNIPVALARCQDYYSPSLPETVGILLDAIGYRPQRCERVLVKPNLLAATPPDFLPCTHPQVVRAACLYLLEGGAKVQVGDSPSLGTAAQVAAKIGLLDALADLGVPLVELHHPKVMRLSFPLGRVGLSRRALDNDLILNLPKLKVHRMLRLTGAVKNFFGCITGIRKAMMHVAYGWGNRFEGMLLDLHDLLPPSLSLMDAVTAMHVGGPVHGQPYNLGLLAASPSPVGLDAAVFNLLGQSAADVATWQEALRRRLPGAALADLWYPLEPPQAFANNGFQIPRDLDPVGFNPVRLMKSSMKHLRATWTQRRPRGEKPA